MIEPLKKLYTVTEYHALLDAGILHEDDRVELIEGEIRPMPAIGSRHFSGVLLLDRLFQRGLGDDVMIAIQSPFQLNDFSEPEPDLLLLRFKVDAYANSLPTVGDILLLIEVSESSVQIDRDKMELYAGNGISEAWLVNLKTSVIEVYRNPVQGRYLDVKKLRRGDRISALAFPDFVLDVSAIFG
jgi:Uma2 family endonuclease